MAIHFVEKQARWPLFVIAFLKCSKHNYQLDQVLENFKYSFYCDGITLSLGLESWETFGDIYGNATIWIADANILS